MGTKGALTRTQIMDTAQSMILARGYSGTSIEQVINQLGLTKGAFFHHFNNKADLGRALIQRYSDDGIAVMQSTLERAQKLSDDPLQQFLIVIGLYVEEFEGLTEPYEGCLLASYVYELQLFDEDVRSIINAEMLHWRKVLTALIDRIKLRYPPQQDVDSTVLADMFLSTFEGAFILSKSLREPDVTAQQLKLYRTLIESLFTQR